MKVRDIMTKKLITVSPDTEINKAAGLLMGKHINGVPVVDKDGRLLGILCQSDLVMQQKKLPLPSFFTLLDGFIPLTSERKIEKEIQKIAATTVKDAMTPDPVTISPDATLDEVASIMVENKYHTIPVLDEEKLVGIVGKEDVLKVLMP